MEIATAWLINYGLITVGSTLAAIICGWILKKIPFDKFAKWAERVGEIQGKAITKFFNTKLPALWNSIIEPIFIDTINAFLFSWIRGFIGGLKSDNTKSKK